MSYVHLNRNPSRGGTELLGTQAEQLSRLAHRLIWVNPHAGKDGYAPVQGGIVAALPHLDDLLAGHSLDTLEKLLEVVRNALRDRPARRLVEER